MILFLHDQTLLSYQTWNFTTFQRFSAHTKKDTLLALVNSENS